MTFNTLKNELTGWGCCDYWRKEYKTLWEMIDQFLDDGGDWVLEDKGYEIEDCDYYIECCNCAIKRYPHKDIFKTHLLAFKDMKDYYKGEQL